MGSEGIGAGRICDAILFLQLNGIVDIIYIVAVVAMLSNHEGLIGTFCAVLPLAIPVHLDKGQ